MSRTVTRTVLIDFVIPNSQHFSDLAAIHDAISAARKSTNKPTIVRLRTTIGYGSREAGTHGVHGSRTSHHLSISNSFDVF